MASEKSLADQVKTIQGYMGKFAKSFKDLTERVKTLEDKRMSNDEKEIKEIMESQRVVDEILVANTDAIKQLNMELSKVEEEINKQKCNRGESVETPVEYVVKQGERGKICRYNNRGHCRYRDRCKYYHSRDVCKTYLESKKCDYSACADRHPKVCKYWLKSKSGCLRKSTCDYLHDTLGQNKEKSKALENGETSELKCVGCGGSWTDKNCVVKHDIKNHELYFCLNCDDWVQQKEKVLEANWSLFDDKGNLRYDV